MVKENAGLQRLVVVFDDLIFFVLKQAVSWVGLLITKGFLFFKKQVRTEEELTEAIETATGAQRTRYVSLKLSFTKTTQAKNFWNGDPVFLLLMVEVLIPSSSSFNTKLAN